MTRTMFASTAVLKDVLASMKSDIDTMTLDERLDRIHDTISDQGLYLEAELNAATTANDITKIERRAEASRLLLEHVQSAAWEKAKSIP